MKFDLTLILPVFNEEKRIEKGLKKCDSFFKKTKLKIEVILVDDGSSDETKNLINKLIRNKRNFKLISYSKNKGKGYAIKKGIKKASGKLVLFSDIDFSTPFSELSLFMPFVNKKADIIIGTRKVKGAEIIQHQSRLREWLGRRFTDLTNLWLGMDISDYTCGFKLFKTKTAKELFNLQKIRRWAFDAEILYIANKKGKNIIEVPITWKNDQKTKVSLGRDILQSLWELILIRWHSLKGDY